MKLATSDFKGLRAAWRIYELFSVASIGSALILLVFLMITSSTSGWSLLVLTDVYGEGPFEIVAWTVALPYYVYLCYLLVDRLAGRP